MKNSLNGKASLLKKSAMAVALFILLFSVPAGAETEDEVVDAYLSYFAPQTMSAARMAAARSSEQQGVRMDATMARLRLLRNWDQLSAESHARVEDFVSVEERAGKRQVYDTSYTSCTMFFKENPSLAKVQSSDHFSIIYTLSGSNAVSDVSENGIPVYVSTLLQILEQSWNHEVGTLGLPGPTGPSQSWFDGNSGLPLPENNKYPVYVCDLYGMKSGVLGITYNTEVSVGTARSGSYIELDNNYTNTSPAPIHLYNGITVTQLIQVIAAHEFFHAIQFGMNWYAPSYWLMEISSTWMEDEVFPDVNDYIPQYLGNRFNNTNVSIDHFSSADIYAYGSVVFFKHITEHVAGPSFVANLWYDLRDGCVSTQSYQWCRFGDFDSSDITEIPLIGTELQQLGTSLAAVFRDYSTAIFTKSLVDGSLSYYPNVRTTEITDITVPKNGSLDHLAANYYLVTASTGTNIYRFSLSFTGNSAATWEVAVVTQDTYGSYNVNNLTLTSGSGNITIPGFGASFDKAIIIVNNVHQTADGKPYTLNVAMQPGCGNPETSGTFAQGWHLISMPFIPDSRSASSINFQTGDSLIAYDPETKELVYKSETDFPGIGESGRGFWFYRNNPGTLSTTSCPNQNSEQIVSLKAGWNIFGNPFDSQVDWSDTHIKVLLPGSTQPVTLSTAEASGWISGVLYDWDGSDYISHASNNGSKLEPWKGYWIKTGRDVILKIVAPD